MKKNVKVSCQNIIYNFTHLEKIRRRSEKNVRIYSYQVAGTLKRWGQSQVQRTVRYRCCLAGQVSMVHSPSHCHPATATPLPLFARTPPTCTLCCCLLALQVHSANTECNR